MMQSGKGVEKKTQAIRAQVNLENYLFHLCMFDSLHFISLFIENVMSAWKLYLEESETCVFEKLAAGRTETAA